MVSFTSVLTNAEGTYLRGKFCGQLSGAEKKDVSMTGSEERMEVRMALEDDFVLNTTTEVQA